MNNIDVNGEAKSFERSLKCIDVFLAAIAALYVTMSVCRMVGWSDGRMVGWSVCVNEFQS